MKSPQRGWIGVLVFLGILLAIYLPFMLAKPRPAPVQLPAAASAALSAFSASDERGQVGMVPDIAAYRQGLRYRLHGC